MSNLVVAVYEGKNPRILPWTTAFADGLSRHNIEVRKFKFCPEIVEDADLHVFWSMRTPEVIGHCHERRQTFVCIDHGYTEDRMDFASLNLNNLNAKSELDVSDLVDDSSRCEKHGWRIKERQGHGEKVIIVGQVTGDKSLEGADIYDWAKFKIAELEILGQRTQDILFKPHPREKPWAIDRAQTVGAPVFEGSLDEAYAIAKVFLTYSSTTAVAAWLNGVPAWAASPMSMIYKAQFEANTPANRQKWLNDISFRQYNKEELSSGEPWDLLRDRILGKAPSVDMSMVSYERPIERVPTGKLLTVDAA